MATCPVRPLRDGALPRRAVVAAHEVVHQRHGVDGILGQS
jgi:hypothetical protein